MLEWLSTENVVDCRLFAEHGCLAYIVMGLCSQEASVRGCACHLLVSFSHQLHGARFAEQPLITYLLDTLRRSMPSANKKLPPVICLFFARASKLVFNQGLCQPTVLKLLVMVVVMKGLRFLYFYDVYCSQCSLLSSC